jgi:hypothetical protein
MSRFPLIVIPEWQQISPAFCHDLVEYAKDGGNLMVIGEETAKQFAALTGVQLQGNGQTISSLGKGKIGFLPVAVGSEYEKSGDEALRNQVNKLVRVLFPNPLVEVTGSPWVDVSVSRLNNRQVIHLVNTSGDHKGAGIIRTIEPVGPLQVSIRCDRKPSAITLQPAGKTCDFTYTDGKAQLKVDALELYDILVVE